MKKENPLKNRWQLECFGEKMEEKDYSEEWRENFCMLGTVTGIAVPAKPGQNMIINVGCDCLEG